MFAVVSAVLLTPQLPPGVQTALDQWRVDHGQTWQVILDEGTLKARTLFNGRALADTPPQTNQDWFAQGRSWLEEAYGMFGVDGGDKLADKRVLMLPLGMVGGTDKVCVRFVQQKLGVSVTGGAVNALFDMDGNLLSLDSDAIPGLRDFDVSAEVPSTTATAVATEAFHDDTSTYPAATTAPVLTIAQVYQGTLRLGALAWKVDAGDDDHAYSYFVSAKGSPTVVAREPLMHEYAQQPGGPISGTVSGNVTVGAPNWTADNGFNSAPAPLGHLYIRRTSDNSILTTTNGDGTFQVTGSPNPIGVTLRFQGPYVNVCSLDSLLTLIPKCPPLTGIDHKLNTSISMGSANSLMINPAYDELVVAQANAFHRINQMRDWIRYTNPLDDTFDQSAPYKARPNRKERCGAAYDGMNDLIFFARKDLAGVIQCPRNFAYAVVTWHEMGHWMNDLYGHGNSSLGFGEGAADVWCMYQTDYSEIVGSPRSGNNTLCFCGDCSPCYSQPQPDCPPPVVPCQGCHETPAGNGHTNGEVLMGALWKVRV